MRKEKSERCTVNYGKQKVGRPTNSVIRTRATAKEVANGLQKTLEQSGTPESR